MAARIILKNLRSTKGSAALSGAIIGSIAIIMLGLAHTARLKYERKAMVRSLAERVSNNQAQASIEIVRAFLGGSAVIKVQPSGDPTVLLWLQRLALPGFATYINETTSTTGSATVRLCDPNQLTAAESDQVFLRGVIPTSDVFGCDQGPTNRSANTTVVIAKGANNDGRVEVAVKSGLISRTVAGAGATNVTATKVATNYGVELNLPPPPVCNLRAFPSAVNPGYTGTIHFILTREGTSPSFDMNLNLGPVVYYTDHYDLTPNLNQSFGTAARGEVDASLPAGTSGTSTGYGFWAGITGSSGSSYCSAWISVNPAACSFVMSWDPVLRYYHALLGREPDPPGLVANMQGLVGNETSVPLLPHDNAYSAQDLETVFRSSLEWNLPDRGQPYEDVANMYRSITGEIGDVPTNLYWRGIYVGLGGSSTDDTVLEDAKKDTAKKMRHDLRSSAKVGPIHPDVVYELCRNVLGRIPNRDEMVFLWNALSGNNYYTSLVGNPHNYVLSYREVEDYLRTIPEYNARGGGAGETVTYYFLALLNRVPTDAELAIFVPLIQANVYSQAQIVATIRAPGSEYDLQGGCPIVPPVIPPVIPVVPADPPGALTCNILLHISHGSHPEWAAVWIPANRHLFNGCEDESCMHNIRPYIHAAPWNNLPRHVTVGTQTFDIYTSGHLGSPNCRLFTTENYSPLVVLMDEKPLRLLPSGANVLFDIEGKGNKIKVFWPEDAKQAYFLALDKNGNGDIDGVQELFGDGTDGGKGKSNGFDALAKYDTNKDGVIDASDEIFTKLRLWGDTNHNGHAEPGELHTLAEMKVKRIKLKYKSTTEAVGFEGNEIHYDSVVEMESGPNHRIVDLWLVNDYTKAVSYDAKVNPKQASIKPRRKVKTP